MHPNLSRVDAEWMAAKKDWDNAEKRFRAHERQRSSTSDSQRTSSLEGGVHPDASGDYQPEMDEMRCILYAHGGNPSLGSIPNANTVLICHVIRRLLLWEYRSRKVCPKGYSLRARE